jgi:6-phosphofructokinase 1
MLAWQNGQVVAVPIAEVVAKSPLSVDSRSELVQAAISVGIYVGTPKLSEI